MLLNYTPPFNFRALLNFMRLRAITGVEQVTENSYARSFCIQQATGFFMVKNCPEHSALSLHIDTDDIRCHMAIHQRVRKMFDLDSQMSVIKTLLAEDAILKPGLEQGEVPRLPVAFDSLEFTLRAILGQQVSLKAARTLANRLVQTANLRTPAEFPDGLSYFFPDLNTLLSLPLTDIGLSKIRQATIQAVLQAVAQGRISLDANQSFEQFYEDFSRIKGIGDWTVNYVAMRGLGMKDCFPASDLGIVKVLSAIQGEVLKAKQIRQLAEHWRPYRAYAALCLWNQYQG
ncbi:DNA-3-methyladenine glycosylase family protein [Candidatus Venteria ishoeyi]|nr:AlkA N-terminal domain-containing protein [Candidatus Venteria ishoeyi]